MMVQRKVFLYVIYDTVAEDVSPVFEAVNDLIAMRYFRKMLVEVPEKDEYKLYRVGDYEVNEKLTTGIEIHGTEPVEVPTDVQNAYIDLHGAEPVEVPTEVKNA